MEKLKMHSANLTQDNIARIRDLFPNCITEAKGEDGSVKLVVDFDQLRQELAESIVEGSQERYHLNWPGKREALLTANSPIAMTLRPCREESVNFDTTKNLFIEGDNLDALKLLQDNYLGKVKMIYIDPPYNTGNDFIYEDDFAEDATSFLKKSNQKDDEGNRLIANTEANGRFHSDWLSMIYPRLRIARTLLRDDGVIFISIDDNEAANLKKICDEVFGEANFLANIVWRRTVSGAVSGQGFTVSHDHILCYAKSENYSLGRLEVEDEDKYKNPDNDPRGSYKTQKLERTLEGARPTMTFEIQTPAGPITRTWACSPQKYQELLADNRIVFSSSGQPYYKQFLNEYKGRLPDTWWEKSQGNNQEGSKELSALMGQKNIFTNPKPTKLIKHALRIGCGPNDIFMDFFAGSGSSADAVMQLNAEDGGRRRFIMVQLPEVCRTDSEAYKAGFKNIAEITRQRIRLSGAKIFQDSGKGAGDIDIGFRSFRVDSSNLKDVFYTPDAMEVGNLDLFVDNIKPDRTPEDLLFQVMLDWGVDLALPITKQAIQDKYVFLVDGNALAACFDGHGGVDEDFVKELAKVQPLRAVFRDAGFKDSSVKINVEQIFKLLSPATEVKCI